MLFSQSVTDVLLRVDILRCCGPALSLSVSYNTCYNEIRFIHHSPESYRQGISKLSAFMDGAGSLRIDVTA